MLMVAMLLAAAAPQPWVGISAGPMFVRESGRAGVRTGPLLRVEVGVPFAERAAAEIWLTTTVERAPMSSPGDQALIGGGGGARLLVARLDSDRQLGLWLHGGAGWGVPVAGDPDHGGPMGFGGPLLTFQPFVKRFTLGLEGDVIAWRNGLGFAVLPSLRCAF